MSGFSFTGQVTAPADQLIENDGFFPAVDPADVRKLQRLREGTTADQLSAAIVAAMLKVAPDLDAWAEAQRAAGHETLGDVPSPTLAGSSRIVLLYLRAVACYARAELMERNRDVDLTARGAGDAAELEPSIDELRRDARFAIRDLLGRSRLEVELI